jgi:hypothetical protein
MNPQNPPPAEEHGTAQAAQAVQNNDHLQQRVDALRAQDDHAAKSDPRNRSPKNRMASGKQVSRGDRLAAMTDILKGTLQDTAELRRRHDIQAEQINQTLRMQGTLVASYTVRQDALINVLAKLLNVPNLRDHVDAEHKRLVGEMTRKRIEKAEREASPAQREQAAQEAELAAKEAAVMASLNATLGASRPPVRADADMAEVGGVPEGSLVI